MRLMFVLLLAAVAGCAGHEDTIEMGSGEWNLPAQELLQGDDWGFSLDGRQWVIGSNAVDGKARLREYILKGERINKWTELVTSYTEDPGRDIKMSDFLDIMKQSMEKDCSSLVWNVISGGGTDDVIFEWMHKGCQGFPAQHELRRVCKKGTLYFNLSYVKRTPQLTEKERAAWIQRITAAVIRSRDDDTRWREGAGAVGVERRDSGAAKE